MVEQAAAGGELKFRHNVGFERRAEIQNNLEFELTDAAEKNQKAGKKVEPDLPQKPVEPHKPSRNATRNTVAEERKAEGGKIAGNGRPKVASGKLPPAILPAKTRDVVGSGSPKITGGKLPPVVPPKTRGAFR